MAAMLCSALAFSTLLTSAQAAPWQHWYNRNAKDTGKLQPTEPGLPSNAAFTFKYVGLGVGVQNYSCASTTSSPVATGALATLFDATTLFTNFPSVINHVSDPTLKLYEHQRCTKTGNPNVADDSCEEWINYLNLPVLGHHFFANVNGKAVPSFDINTRGDYLSAAKLADAPAPASAYDGADGAGAVAWLYLADDGSGRSHGLKEVYRVDTAGGTPTADACKSGQKEIGVKYAAQYWFYD